MQSPLKPNMHLPRSIMTEFDTLVADIGGTNARFALVSKHDPTSLNCFETLPTNGYATLVKALDHYLRKNNIVSLAAMTLGVAAPIINDRAKFTNASWVVDRAELAAHYCCGSVKLLNDFEAIALSLPYLAQHDLHHLGALQLRSTDHSHLGVLGAGTGLGAATLLVRNSNSIPLGCEAGHTSFTPENERQQQVREYLLKAHQRVSYERVLSGMGVENIYEALENNHHRLNAKDIFARHLDRSDQIASDTVLEFTKILGQFAGDFALTTGCYNGIFLAGGVISKQLRSIDALTFRQSFENKGRHRELMRAIPTAVIAHKQPGLVGAAIAATAGFTHE